MIALAALQMLLPALPALLDVFQHGRGRCRPTLELLRGDSAGGDRPHLGPAPSPLRRAGPAGASIRACDLGPRAGAPAPPGSAVHSSPLLAVAVGTAAPSSLATGARSSFLDQRGWPSCRRVGISRPQPPGHPLRRRRRLQPPRLLAGGAATTGADHPVAGRRAGILRARLSERSAGAPRPPRTRTAASCLMLSELGVPGLLALRRPSSPPRQSAALALPGAPGPSAGDRRRRCVWPARRSASPRAPTTGSGTTRA